MRSQAEVSNRPAPTMVEQPHTTSTAQAGGNARSRVIRLRTLWESIRATYWAVPSLMALAPVSLSAGLVRLDETVTARWVDAASWVYTGGPEGARAVLSTIAASMITVAGVTFSITIVALTLASQQFGPRLLRKLPARSGQPDRPGGPSSPPFSIACSCCERFADMMMRSSSPTWPSRGASSWPCSASASRSSASITWPPRFKRSRRAEFSTRTAREEPGHQPILRSSISGSITSIAHQGANAPDTDVSVGSNVHREAHPTEPSNPLSARRDRLLMTRRGSARGEGERAAPGGRGGHRSAVTERPVFRRHGDHHGNCRGIRVPVHEDDGRRTSSRGPGHSLRESAPAARNRRAFPGSRR